MQDPYNSTDRPSVQDLYTIDIGTGNVWYWLGLELGLSIESLENIKTKHAKAQQCKRVMYKEWLRVCSRENCTWGQLLKALSKVDQSLANKVSRTIAIELEATPDTATSFHLSSTTSQVSPSPSSSLEYSAKTRQPGSKVTQMSKRRITTDSDSDSKLSKYSQKKSREEEGSSESVVSENRSVSTEAFQTASEDELVQPFNHIHSGEPADYQSGSGEEVI